MFVGTYGRDRGSFTVSMRLLDSIVFEADDIKVVKGVLEVLFGLSHGLLEGGCHYVSDCFGRIDENEAGGDVWFETMRVRLKIISEEEEMCECAMALGDWCQRSWQVISTHLTLTFT